MGQLLHGSATTVKSLAIPALGKRPRLAADLFVFCAVSQVAFAANLGECNTITKQTTDRKRSAQLNLLLSFSLVLALLTAAATPATAEAKESLQANTSLPLGLGHLSSPLASAAQLELGSYLFRSKSLSLDRSMACSSCHDPRAAFGDGRLLNLRIEAPTGRKAPPLFNLAFFANYMADGRADSLKAQILIPLVSEMHVDWPLACRGIISDPGGDRLLLKAGVGLCSMSVVVQSLTAYVGSLVSGNSSFDEFYYGGKADALTEEEQRGFRVFVRKGHCSTCHLLNGFAAPFTDGGFHSVGVGYVGGVYKDHGRMGVSHQPSDDGAFKTPTLRNVALRTSFMHDGSLSSLRGVIDYYDQGGTVGARNQDPRIHKLFLSDEEKTDLIAFLRSLNSPVETYIPEPIAGAAYGSNSALSP